MPSTAWSFFQKTTIDGKTKAKCPRCKDILGANTTGLKSHALTKHGVDVDKLSSVIEATKDQPPITNYLQIIKQDTLPALCARLCVKDGFPFSAVATSDDIQRWISSDKIGKTPQTHHTVRRHVMAFAEDAKKAYKIAIKSAKQSDGLLAISFDEWTSKRNRRYMGLLVHSATDVWHLGLIRIHGSTDHQLAIEDIEGNQ